MRFVVQCICYELNTGPGNMISLIYYGVSVRMHRTVYSSPIVFLNKLPILQIVTSKLSFASVLLVVKVILCQISELFNAEVILLFTGKSFQPHELSEF